MKTTYTNITIIFGLKSILFFCCILLKLNLYSQCNSQLAYWDFDDCTAGNMVKDGTIPSQQGNGGCSSITSSIFRIDPATLVLIEEMEIKLIVLDRMLFQLGLIIALKL